VTRGVAAAVLEEIDLGQEISIESRSWSARGSSRRPGLRILKAWLLAAGVRQSRADFQPRDCGCTVNALNVAARHIYSQRALSQAGATSAPAGAGRDRPASRLTCAGRSAATRRRKRKGRPKAAFLQSISKAYTIETLALRLRSRQSREGRSRSHHRPGRRLGDRRGGGIAGKACIE
jgi:hypothetical protein